MKICPHETIEGVYVIELEPRADERGFFMRSYDAEIFRRQGIDRAWVQENHSLSVNKGVIRGLHVQLPPHSETKLVRSIRGKILDVFVDLRKSSKTFGNWGSVELSAKNKKAVYLPAGLAHGFCTLTENCETLYKVDAYYAPESEVIIRWDDPALGIEWPEVKPVLSDKDKKAKGLESFVKKYGGLKV